MSNKKIILTSGEAATVLVDGPYVIPVGACPIARAENYQAALLDCRRAAEDLINGVRLGFVRIECEGHGDRAALDAVLGRLRDALERSAP